MICNLPLVYLSSFLQRIGSLGGWTVTSDVTAGSWEESSFDVTHSIAQAHKLGAAVVFGFDVGPDLRNSSVVVLQVIISKL